MRHKTRVTGCIFNERGEPRGRLPQRRDAKLRKPPLDERIHALPVRYSATDRFGALGTPVSVARHGGAAPDQVSRRSGAQAPPPKQQARPTAGLFVSQGVTGVVPTVAGGRGCPDPRPKVGVLMLGVRTLGLGSPEQSINYEQW